MGPMCKIETAHQPCSRRSVTAFPGCAISLPMAAMRATSCALRSRATATGASRSSSNPTPPRASRFYRAGGLLNAPSPGLAAADVSPRAGRKPSKAPQRGRSSPASGSSHADSQDIAIQHKLLGRALNNIVEQDHRRIKRLVQPGLGFGSLQTARRTLAGYVAMAMIRKGQVRNIGGGDMRGEAPFVAGPFGGGAWLGPRHGA